MSFSVRFIRNAAAHYTFPIAPFVSPIHGQEIDDLRNLVALTKTWVVETLFTGKEDAVITAWNALKAKIEDPTQYPDGVELLRDGVAVDSIRVSDGFYNFHIEQLDSPRSDLQWRGELKIRLRIVGRKLLSYNPGALSPISSIEQQEEWNYDETGLLTRTLTGELEVTQGNSAQAQARTLGLTLPGSDFAFVTNGPEGVDVVKLDRLDLTARWTSIIRQAGAVLPGNVGPSFSVIVETEKKVGEEITTTTVTARGTGATAAVNARIPTKTLQSIVRTGDFDRSAVGVFITKKPASGQVLRLYRFESTGGGRKVSYRPRTGGRRPVKHVGPFEPVVINEEIRVERYGPSGSGEWKMPIAVSGDGMDLDTGSIQVVGPYVVEIGKDAAASKWALEVRRSYKAVDYGVAFDAVMKAILQPGLSLTLDALTRVPSDGLGG